MAKRYSGVRHIRDNIFEINYYPFPGAPRRQHRIEAASVKEAYLIRASKMSGHDPSDAHQGNISFADLKSRLELKLKADNLSKKTIKNLMWKFKNFFEVFLPEKYPHVTSINQITGPIIESYKQQVVVEWARPTGWRDELTKIKTIFKKLTDIGCCNKDIYYDVLSNFKRPKGNKKLYKEVSKADMKKLLDYIKTDRPGYYGITYFIMRLGWRRTQVISIRRKNIRWKGLQPVEILIEPQDTKTKEPFVLRDIDKELAKVIKQNALRSKRSEWLFPNRKGDRHHPNHYSEYVKKVSYNVLGIGLTPHDFRHSFCTARIKEGAAPRDIMAVTGHKDIESFNIYTHATSEGTKKVLEDSKLF